MRSLHATLQLLRLARSDVSGRVIRRPAENDGLPNQVQIGQLNLPTGDEPALLRL